jgi:hypothetical protein
MSRDVTITIQDSENCVRVRIQTWDQQIHMSFDSYVGLKETETSAPTFTLEAARTFARTLLTLTDTQ